MQSRCSLLQSRISNQVKVIRSERKLRKRPFKYLCQTKRRRLPNTSGLRGEARSKRRRRFGPRHINFRTLENSAINLAVAVSFQIIWRLPFHAIWRMMRRTKEAEQDERPGFAVRICTEDCFGSVPVAPASLRRAQALEDSGSRCGHWMANCSAISSSNRC
jgi:hypothetical protein